MKYPLGIQDFRSLREGGYVYVDKTEHLARVADAGKAFFLSRPRRFGKSLALSTLNELYSGSGELFGGLWAERHWDFAARARPVIWLRFASSGFRSNGVEYALHDMLDREAARLGIVLSEGYLPDHKFRELIEAAAAKTEAGRVVVLVDEYDKPIVDYLEDLPRAEGNRDRLKTFYSVLKDADPYLELVFITGVSAFAKVSIFSDLNNVVNLSLNPLAHTLVGITAGELEATFAARLDELPVPRDVVRRWYNGYRFGYDAERVYNPWSILSLLSTGELRNYWFETGTPGWLVKLMRGNAEYAVAGRQTDVVDLANFDLAALSPLTVLFQAGYLTIADYAPEDHLYTLDYPNLEVRQSLELVLLREYLPTRRESPRSRVVALRNALQAGDLDEAMALVDATFAEIPFPLWAGNERESFYHAVVYLLFRLVGTYITAEVSTARGRVDAIVETAARVYAFEFKLDRPVEEALRQIRDRGYLDAYTADARERVAVGVRFDGEGRCVGEWRAETYA